MKEQTIKILVLNEIFKNKGKYLFDIQKGHTGVLVNYEGNQGEYNEIFKFYKHESFPENVFLRETYNTDSYGENESIVEIQFVEGKERTIKVFEPIKS